MQSFAELVAAIVDDHPIFRTGLAALLKEEMGFGAIHQGASAEDAIALAERHAPDIFFLDLSMPGGGIAALKQIAEILPSARAVLLTACDAAETAIEALNEGASGYILKGVGATELTGAVNTILNGGTFVSPSFAATLLRAAQAPGDAAQSDVYLTQREIQVLRELEQGHTNREIAQRLTISEKTVKFYMTNIMQKYGVKNRVAAVMAFQKDHPAARDGAPGLPH